MAGMVEPRVDCTLESGGRGNSGRNAGIGGRQERWNGRWNRAEEGTLESGSGKNGGIDAGVGRLEEQWNRAAARTVESMLDLGGGRNGGIGRWQERWNRVAERTLERRLEGTLESGYGMKGGTDGGLHAGMGR